MIKSRKGFTLIELMVVIVILGILAAVVAPRIPQFVNKAKEGKTKGNLGTLRSTLNIYYGDNDGKYPNDGDLACLVPKYLKKIPEAELPGSHPASGAVAAMTSAAMVYGDVGGWLYANVETNTTVWGNVVLNCNAHNDSVGVAWSSY